MITNIVEHHDTLRNMRAKLECRHQDNLIFDDEYPIHRDCYGVAYHCAKCGKDGFVYITYREWVDLLVWPGGVLVQG